MIDQQLKELQNKISRKSELEELTVTWKAEQAELAKQVSKLHTAMLEEQSDVDKLEAGGIGTVFHKLTGRMEEKLDKERMEAQTASDEYNCAAAALEELEANLSNSEIELEELADCQTQYRQLMLNRIRELESMAANSPDEATAETLKLQLQLERRRKSLREALLEADDAARAASKAMDALKNTRQRHRNEAEKDTADSTQDLLAAADVHAQILLEEITDLQAKLAQMGIDPEPHISIGAYLKAPTAYIAGAGSDNTQLDQMNKAILQIEELQFQISKIDEKLLEALEQIEARLAAF